MRYGLMIRSHDLWIMISPTLFIINAMTSTIKYLLKCVVQVLIFQVDWGLLKQKPSLTYLHMHDNLWHVNIYKTKLILNCDLILINKYHQRLHFHVNHYSVARYLLFGYENAIILHYFCLFLLSSKRNDREVVSIKVRHSGFKY